LAWMHGWMDQVVDQQTGHSLTHSFNHSFDHSSDPTPLAHHTHPSPDPTSSPSPRSAASGWRRSSRRLTATSGGTVKAQSIRRMGRKERHESLAWLGLVREGKGGPSAVSPDLFLLVAAGAGAGAGAGASTVRGRRGAHTQKKGATRTTHAWRKPATTAIDQPV